MASINEDLVVRGRLTPNQLDIPAGTITNAEVSASAAVATTKLKHRFHAGHSQPNTTSTTETRNIFVARSAGTISEIVAGSIVANIGDSTVTVDLKKNGTSVMTSILTLDSGNVARVVEVGVLNGSLTTLAAGDWLEIVITATVGTGTLSTGLFVQAVLDMSP